MAKIILDLIKMRMRTGPIKPEAKTNLCHIELWACGNFEAFVRRERLTICQNAKIIFPQLKDNGQGVRKLKCGEKCCPDCPNPYFKRLEVNKNAWKDRKQQVLFVFYLIRLSRSTIYKYRIYNAIVCCCTGHNRKDFNEIKQLWNTRKISFNWRYEGKIESDFHSITLGAQNFDFWAESKTVKGPKSRRKTKNYHFSGFFSCLVFIRIYMPC